MKCIKEYANKLKKPISFLCACLVFACSFLFFPSFESSAADVDGEVVLMPFAEPMADEYHGYMNIRVIYTNSSGTDIPRYFTFAFDSHQVQAEGNSHPDPWCYVSFSGNTISFNFSGFDGYHSLYMYSAQSLERDVLQNSAINSSSYTYTFGSSYTVDSSTIQLYGAMRSAVTPSNDVSFSVLWCPDSVTYSLLKDIYDVLGTIDTDTSNISNKINGIYNELIYQGSSLDTVNSRLLTIYQELNKFRTQSQTNDSTIISKLDEIINALVQSDEEPPEEVDKSTVNDYGSTEQELTNNENTVSSSDVAATLDVDLSDNSSGFGAVWDLMTNALGSNSKVFSAVTSLLTFGVIGLILGK